MKFDFCGQYKFDNAVVDYGWIKGNEKIVFIKAGLGGDFRGYDNKYVKIAQRLNDKYGCSVVSVSNPNVKSHTFVHDKKVIEDFILAGDYNSPKLYFFGHSNGGVKGLELASSGIIFKNINPIRTLKFERKSRIEKGHKTVVGYSFCLTI